MARMIELLREEHRNMQRLLAALEHQIELFAEGGAPDYDVIIGVADYFLDYPDRCHHPKEDAIARRLEPTEAEAGELTTVLAAEHLALKRLARSFRDSVGVLLGESDVPREAITDAARAFIATQRRHLALEEASFFSLAEQTLTDADWREIEAELGHRADPVFGGRAEAMFQTLSARLLAWEAEDEAAPNR